MSRIEYDTRAQPGLEVVTLSLPQDMVYYQPKTEDGLPYNNQLPSASSSRICGLSARTFWVTFALVLVVLGSAIGGGVAGGLSAARKDKSVSTPPPQQPISSTSFSSSTSSISPSTTIPSLSSTSTGIPPSSTQPGTYRIINIATNTAIDLLNGDTTNNTEIECWQWIPYSAPVDYVHQAWQIESLGNGAINIFNTQTNSYITAPNNLIAGVNPIDNASVYGEVPGSPADPHAQWVIVTNSDNSVSFWSKAYSTKVLDLTDSNSADGTPVILWEQNGGSNQEWILVPS